MRYPISKSQGNPPDNWLALPQREGRRDEGKDEDQEGERPGESPPPVEGHFPVKDRRMSQAEHEHDRPPEGPSGPKGRQPPEKAREIGRQEGGIGTGDGL